MHSIHNNGKYHTGFTLILGREVECSTSMKYKFNEKVIMLMKILGALNLMNKLFFRMIRIYIKKYYYESGKKCIMLLENNSRCINSK